MGLYINVPNQDKVEWLETNAIEIDKTTFLDCKDAILSDTVGVCVVNNMTFSAAAIAYNARERHRFSSLKDPRPRRYFIVDTELVKPFCDGWNDYIN